MKRRTFAGAALASGALLGAAGLLLGAGTRAVAIANCDTNTAALDSTEQQMLDLMNAARLADGKGPLVPAAALNRAAAWKSEDGPKTGLSHTDSRDRDPFVRMADCGYTSGGLGENVGVGSSGTSATAMFNAFMASEDHRAAILEPRGKAVGVGRAGGHWTLNFGTIVDSGAPTPDTPAATATPTRTATPTPAPAPKLYRVQIPMVGAGQ